MKYIWTVVFLLNFGVLHPSFSDNPQDSHSEIGIDEIVRELGLRDDESLKALINEDPEPTEQSCGTEEERREQSYLQAQYRLARCYFSSESLFSKLKRRISLFYGENLFLKCFEKVEGPLSTEEIEALRRWHQSTMTKYVSQDVMDCIDEVVRNLLSS